MVAIPAIPFPDGVLGVAAKAALAVLGCVWWTSGPGADEARCVVVVVGCHCALLLSGTPGTCTCWRRAPRGPHPPPPRNTHQRNALGTKRRRQRTHAATSQHTRRHTQTHTHTHTTSHHITPHHTAT